MCAAGLVLCLVSSPLCAQDGMPLTIEGPPHSVSFGGTIATGGDANRDGVPDLIVTDPDYLVDDNQRIYGRWFVYSGSDAQLLWSTDDREPTVRGDGNAAFIGDVDGDRHDDVAIGQSDGVYGGLGPGRVEVYSGRTGQHVRTLRGKNEDDRFGRDIANVGDINDDGVDDIAVVARWAEDGRVDIYSGREFEVISRIDVPWPRRIAPLGDVTGDRYGEIVVGSSWDQDGGWVFSARDGKIIYFIPTPDELNLSDDFGYSVAGGLDATGDSIPDFAIGSATGHFYVYSGVDGTFVNRFESPRTHVQLGDVTGDGIAELVTFYSVFDVRTGELLRRFVPLHNTNPVNAERVAVADFNRDDRADIIAGAGEKSVHISAGTDLNLSLPPDQYHKVFYQARQASLTVAGGQPGERVLLLRSFNGTACTYVPQLEACIDLKPPIVVIDGAVVPPDGRITFTFRIPPDARFGERWLQAVEVAKPTRKSRISNINSFVVPDV